MESDAKESSWFWLIFTIVLMIGLWYAASSALNIAEVSANWPKYRCSPTVMPFASLYGYDTSQNFNYCLKGIFEGQLGGVTGPFSTILGTITTTLMTFLKNLNSMRIMISTLVGGISQILQEFADRFKLLFSQIKLSFLKLQMLMKRLFGTFHSVIYMGLSAIQVGQNFSETFIFKFLDTFCFAPETLIDVHGRGLIPIKNVLLGDSLLNNTKVTSVYRFMANGQPMVSLNGIIVSTNHFVRFNNNFIEAKNHPDAVPIASWSGGELRPLICLDTTSHTIPIQDYIFSDWDETNAIDEQYMLDNESVLNNVKPQKQQRPWIFQPALADSIELVCSNNIKKQCNEIQLGDQLSTGRVMGIGKRLIYEWCELPSGLLVTPSTLFWNEKSWVRAGNYSETHKSSNPRIFYSFVVLGNGSGTIELSSGEYVRDMCEVHSPDTEGLIRILFKD